MTEIPQIRRKYNSNYTYMSSEQFILFPLTYIKLEKKFLVWHSQDFLLPYFSGLHGPSRQNER